MTKIPESNYGTISDINSKLTDSLSIEGYNGF